MKHVFTVRKVMLDILRRCLTLTRIEDIKVGINKKLETVFGEEYSIYTEMEETKQDLNLPAFFIKHVKSSQIHKIGQRYYKNNSFVIKFYPRKNGSELAQCDEVGDKLLNCLEYIESNDVLLRGSKMSLEVTDAELSFSMEFNFQILKTSNKHEFMGEFEQLSKTKG